MDCQAIEHRTWMGSSLEHEKSMVRVAGSARDVSAAGLAPAHLERFRNSTERVSDAARQASVQLASADLRIQVEAQLRGTWVGGRNELLAPCDRFRVRVLRDNANVWSFGSHQADMVVSSLTSLRHEEVATGLTPLTSAHDVVDAVTSRSSLLHLDAPTLGAFLHETVSHMSEEDSPGRSLLGAEAVDNLYVTDDPTDVRAYGYQDRDQLGAVTSPVTLLDRGRVCGLLSGDAHGGRLFSSSPGDELLVRSTHLVAGTHAKWGVRPVGSVLEGHGFVRASVNPTRETFYLLLGASSSTEAGAGGPLVVRGNVRDVLKAFAWVGDDAAYSSAHCYKRNQRWPVSFYTPAAMVPIASARALPTGQVEVRIG